MGGFGPQRKWNETHSRTLAYLWSPFYQSRFNWQRTKPRCRWNRLGRCTKPCWRKANSRSSRFVGGLQRGFIFVWQLPRDLGMYRHIPSFNERNQKGHLMKNITERAEAALDFLTALIIGVGLAALLAAWWSTWTRSSSPMCASSLRVMTHRLWSFALTSANGFAAYAISAINGFSQHPSKGLQNEKYRLLVHLRGVIMAQRPDATNIKPPLLKPSL